MRKFLLIVFLFLCLFNVVHVYAVENSFYSSEYLSGIAYTKYDGKVRYFRNARAIRNVQTGQIVYCLEPFDALLDNVIYGGVVDYDPKFGISPELWEKVKLYAFYGYGYYGHDDIKWISITQMVIWRELHPNDIFEWMDNVTDRRIISPYNDEINELKNLVNNHYKLPSFSNEYVFGINSKVVLEDENNVLNNFVVDSSDFDIEISGNSLTILPVNDVKEGKIVLSKSKSIYSDKVLFYYNDSSQNVVQGGNLEPVKVVLNIKIESGTITVNKVDSELNTYDSQGSAVLDGAVVDLYDKDMNLIDQKEVIDGVIEFIDLPFGKYYISESKAGIGYNVNDKYHEIIIDENNKDNVIIIENEVIKSLVTVTKYYGTKKQYDSNSMNKEQNVNFEIYNDKNEIVFSGVTDENGIFDVVLPYGKYTLKQLDTTDGYSKNNDYSFEVNEDSNASIDIILYDFKVEVPNAGISYGDNIWSKLFLF